MLSVAAAEMELNEQISIPFAPPELIPYLHPQRKMVHIEAWMDVSLDGWAQGCFLHEMSTCALPNWHETFFPVEAIVQGEGLTHAERMAIYVPAMQAEHQKLVSRLSVVHLEVSSYQKKTKVSICTWSCPVESSIVACQQVACGLMVLTLPGRGACWSICMHRSSQICQSIVNDCLTLRWSRSVYMVCIKAQLEVQADAMAALESGTGGPPEQVEAIQGAASFTAPGHDGTQIRQMATLIMDLLTEEASDRYTAEDVCQEEWLTRAVAVPYIGCPIAL